MKYNTEPWRDAIQRNRNERKRKELAAKYGGEFSVSHSLSPAVEAQWLDHIEEFEAHPTSLFWRQFAN